MHVVQKIDSENWTKHAKLSTEKNASNLVRCSGCSRCRKRQPNSRMVAESRRERMVAHILAYVTFLFFAGDGAERSFKSIRRLCFS